ncbi:hypothetical protein LCGC14_2973050, partial [marine sediment metagenome]
GSSRSHSKIINRESQLGRATRQSRIGASRLRCRRINGRQIHDPSPQTAVSILANVSNHANQIVACDFFTVPTVTFRQMYIFILLHHNSRKLLHANITTNPTSAWTAQHIRQAFPYGTVPRFLLRDNDSIYGTVFQRTVESMGIKEVRTAYRSPWQNAYVERVIGSIRRECLNHLIVLNEKGLQKVLDEYVQYYNRTRPHLSLNLNSPIPRNVEPPDNGKVVATPILGGLHHRYSRVA